MTIHKPVLLGETIDGLNLKKGDTVVDATFGGGGHSREILERIMPGGKLVAIDLDESASQNFEKLILDLKLNQEKKNLHFVNGNFSDVGSILKDLNIDKVSAVMADLGISSDQIESSAGLSFQKDTPLDMRLDKKTNLTAADVVNKYSEDRLAEILKKYGEEKYGSSIARGIAKARKIKPIGTTFDLVSIIEKSVSAKYKYRKINPATKTFQALRIEVNKELENLDKFIREAIDCLKAKGRLAVIAFHSGEDRIVKKLFLENARGCICSPVSLRQSASLREALLADEALRAGPSEEFIYGRRGTPRVKIITRKPTRPSAEEIFQNPRSRSAKLRIIEKLS